MYVRWCYTLWISEKLNFYIVYDEERIHFSLLLFPFFFFFFHFIPSLTHSRDRTTVYYKPKSTASCDRTIILFAQYLDQQHPGSRLVQKVKICWMMSNSKRMCVYLLNLQFFAEILRNADKLSKLIEKKKKIYLKWAKLNKVNTGPLKTSFPQRMLLIIIEYIFDDLWISGTRNQYFGIYIPHL